MEYWPPWHILRSFMRYIISVAMIKQKKIISLLYTYIYKSHEVDLFKDLL